MQTGENIWENLWSGITNGASVFANGTEQFLTRLFGSSNERQIRRMQPVVAAINDLEPRMKVLTDTELKELTPKFRQRLADGETLDDLLVEAFAAGREAGRRFLKMRHYDVQLMGGVALHRGMIAEMVTGEGKTLVATLPVYLNALDGKGVHVVTVNDYLARRDREWMGPLYMNLGLSVGAIQSHVDSGGGQGIRRKQYLCDITYGTNNEFGFDYLRDNMKPIRDMQVQRELHYAVIDEVDNILIDEARTPLIISGPAHDDTSKYYKADRLARQLRKDAHFEVKEKEHTCHLTDEGVRKAEEIAGVESFYTAGNMEWPHLIDNALKAHHLYKRDVNYVVQNGEVIIVDEFTGRLMPGRHWSDGLHQAVEAKEGVHIKEESQTLATITLQNYFKLYDKLAGMTGTAMTEAAEFWKIYKLDVLAMPTNKSLIRTNYPDVIYRSEKEKYNAIAEEIERIHKWDVLKMRDRSEVAGTIHAEQEDRVDFEPLGTKDRQWIGKDRIAAISRRGRPILVGTVSIEKSERISAMLGRRGVKHEVLNAKHHEREAEIVAQAGRKDAVTIATNMAGRGTDIILGGNPEYIAWEKLKEKYETRLDVPKEEWDALVAEIEAKEGMHQEGREVAKAGGLHIIGTERHEARRIDNQLRGRAGRQGDPGSSRFFLCLEDDLMRIFAGEWVKNMLTRLGMQEGEAIESKMVSRRIEAAQKKVEERNFDIRKNLLEYDEVMDEQRKRVYSYRQAILDGASCKQLVLDMIRKQIERNLLGEAGRPHAKTGRDARVGFLAPDYGTQAFATWVAQHMGVELEPRELRDMGFDEADDYVKDQAQRQAETLVFDQIEENLPDDPEIDPSEWNWTALAKWANARWGLNLNDRELKKIGRDNLADYLVERAHGAIEKVDLSDGKQYLAEDFGRRTVCNWVRHKFGIEMTPEELEGLEPPQVVELVAAKAREAYTQREIEFPVAVAMARFLSEQRGGQRYDRDALVTWANQRFEADLTPDVLRNRTRHELRDVLLQCSQRFFGNGALTDQLEEHLDTAYGGPPEENGQAAAAAPPPPSPLAKGGQGGAAESNGRAFQELAQWAERTLHCDVAADELAVMDRQGARERLMVALDHRFRPEMHEMERILVLQLLDTAWKDHLYTMDHLRQGIGLRGYAQIDPKVEYKREGMRIFEDMWDRVADQVTDLVFRMEHADASFVGSLWQISEAVHEEAAPTSEIAQQQQAAMESTSGEGPRKVETIRNRGERVGRNDPCPCGSGKKYKNCCLRKSA